MVKGVLIMTVEEMKLAFAKNLRTLMEAHDCTQEDIAKVCNVSQQTVSDWLNGKKYPRMDKVEAMLVRFNVPMNALINDGKEPTEQYYIDPETARLAQAAANDPDMRLLLDAKRDLSPEDMKMIIDLAKRLLNRN